MKVIISPAKKMNMETDLFPVKGLPAFMEKTERLKERIRELSLQEAKALWKCSDRLAELNFKRFQEMELERNLTPAILSYEGLQYQHMAPRAMTDAALQYLEAHLRILSGFYGILGPFDGVVPYRLEMQARLSVDGAADLYGFWGDRLYRSVLDEERILINLASREYALAVERYLCPEDRMITVQFAECSGGKLRQKGTSAKMARGEMVRFMAENQIRDPEDMKNFRALGFSFREDVSDEQCLAFVKEQGS